MTPYYERDGITIYCGDCLEVMPQLGVTVDAIITDLPYGTTACEWDSIIPLESMWKEVKRILKPRGAFVTTASQPFTSMLVMSNLKWFKWEDVWNKKLSTGFLDANRRPLRCHESILIFCDNRPTYNPQMRKGILRNKGNSGPSNCYGNYNRISSFNDDYYPTSIIEISNANQSDKEHPTQKPISLYQYLIRTYTNPGDTVLDFCFGSGTTGVACWNEGRRFIGIEQEEDYCKIAVSRLCQPSLFSILKPQPQPAVEQVALLEV